MDMKKINSVMMRAMSFTISFCAPAIWGRLLSRNNLGRNPFIQEREIYLRSSEGSPLRA